MKIALLIPCTSNNRPWKTINESYLYNLTFKTFLLTQDKEHEYCFYLGIDNDDPIFNIKKEQDVLHKFNKVFKNVHIKFIILNSRKGHLTKMWNELFKLAYSENCDYFYQCGDDIYFHTNGWVNDSINTLQKYNNVGLTGPNNNNNHILTQAFVSRIHMKIFGSFFPENIINWGCDDWYNYVYSPNFYFPLSNHYSENKGGKPRYSINDNTHFYDNYKTNVAKLRQDCAFQAVLDRDKITKFIEDYNY
jgi:hypothetical protein